GTSYWALGGGTGAAPFRNEGGGTGAAPFREEGGGTGAAPFRNIGGGTGAAPLAIITAPLLCADTTVFRVMAPARISMARRRDVSLRDIKSPSEAVAAREHSICNYTNVNELTPRACPEKYTFPLLISSPGFRPRRSHRGRSCRGIVGFRTWRVNGTVVLGLTRLLQGHRPAELAFPRLFRDCLDTSTCYFVAWKVALGRRSS